MLKSWPAKTITPDCALLATRPFQIVGLCRKCGGERPHSEKRFGRTRFDRTLFGRVLRETPMSISVYDQSIALMSHMLHNLDNIVSKAEAYGGANNVED